MADSLSGVVYFEFKVDVFEVFEVGVGDEGWK